MRALDTSKEVRNYAIARAVWNLEKPEIEWLSGYFLRRTKPFQLAQSITYNAGKDKHYIISNYEYEIIPVNFNLKELHNLEDKELLLSFRRKGSFAVVLARLAEEPNRQEIPELY